MDRAIGNRILFRLESSSDAAQNLATEDEVFEHVEKDTLPEVVRLWTNSECLVRGRARNARYGWYNEEVAEKMGIPVFERSTGGGVVYHDFGNLNWSFFLKTSGKFLSPEAAFSMASQYVVEALRRLGVPASFASPNRIDVQRWKVSGMAARSTLSTLLVHGTLLLSSNLDRLNALCLPAAGSPPVANLSEWVPGIDAKGVANTLAGVLMGAGHNLESAEQFGAPE